MCAIMDVYSNKIVDYSIDARMKASLAVRALTNAVALRDPTETIVHRDRGSQFRSRRFVQTSRKHCPTKVYKVPWAVGTWGDNAAMESFFSLLQKNVLDRQRWSTRE